MPSHGDAHQPPADTTPVGESSLGPSPQRFTRATRGLPNVVGLALLFAIATILIGILSAYLLGFQLGTPAPDASWEFERDVTEMRMYHTGGAEVNICSLELKMSGAEPGSGETYIVREAVEGSGVFKQPYINGEEVTDCPAYANVGDNVFLQGTSFVPNDVELVYKTSQGRSYLLGSEEFEDLPHPPNHRDKFMGENTRLGYSTLPGPDDEPRLLFDFSDRVTGNGYMRYLGHQTKYHAPTENGHAIIYPRQGWMWEAHNAKAGVNHSSTPIQQYPSGMQPMFDKHDGHLIVPQRSQDTINWEDPDAVTMPEDVLWTRNMIYGAENGVVRSVQAHHGDLNWELTLDEDINMLYPSVWPKYSEADDWDSHTAFITTDTKLHAINAEAGTVRWSTTVGNITSDTVALPEPLRGRFAATLIADGDVHAVNAETGDTIWTASGDDWTATGNPAVTMKRVLVTTEDGRLMAFNRWTGDHLWSKQVANGQASSVLVGGDIAYLWDQNGNNSKLGAYRVDDGVAVWEKPGLEAAEVMPPHPIISSKGDVIAVGGRGWRDPTPPSATGWMDGNDRPEYCSGAGISICGPIYDGDDGL